MHERVTFLCVRMYSILNIPSPPHDRTYHNSVGVFVIHVNRGSLYMIFQSGKNPKTKKGESLLRSTLYDLSHTIYQSYQPRSLGWRILLSLNRVVGWRLFFRWLHISKVVGEWAEFNFCFQSIQAIWERMYNILYKKCYTILGTGGFFIWLS